MRASVVGASVGLGEAAGGDVVTGGGRLETAGAAPPLHAGSQNTTEISGIPGGIRRGCIVGD
jgi:hypothetical protein